MSNSPVRGRLFMLPTAIATAVAVAFAVLPTAVADPGSESAVSTASPSISATEDALSGTEQAEGPIVQSTPSATTTPLPSNTEKADPTPAESSASSSSATQAAPELGKTPAKVPSDKLQSTPTAGRAAAASVSVGVPGTSAGTNQAKLIVSAAGLRSSGDNLSGLAGATFEFYSVSNENAITGGTLIDSCQTDSSGRCGLIVDLDRTGGTWPFSYKYGNFYAKAVSAPQGWTVAESWGSGDSNLIRFNSGEIRSWDSSRTVELKNSKPYPFVRANVAMPNKCGLDIALVYDLSNSVTASESLMTSYKSAGKTFVDALTGTPSQIGLYTFATRAPAQNSSSKTNNTTLPKTSVAQGTGAANVKTKIDGLGATKDNAEGGTNWDKGLDQIPSGYDAVVFLTDGDPTFYRDGVNDGSGNTTNLRKVEESIYSANRVKNANSRVIAVGIGGSASSTAGKQRLSLISGSAEGSDYFTTGFDTLGSTLKEMATKNCEGTVTVVKSILEPNGTKTAGSGWTFGTPTSGVSVAGSAGTSSGQTDANGALNFKVTGYDSNVVNRQVVIAETQQTGFELSKQAGFNAKCINTATNSSVPVVNSGSLGFELSVPKTAVISCEVINKKLVSGITVVKKAAAYNGGKPVTGPENAPNVPSGTQVTWTYTVTNTGTTKLKNIVVDDDRISVPVTCPATTLAPGASMDCTATGPVKAQ